MMDTDEAIRKRRTVKILAPHDLPIVDCRDTINEILALAGQAPFHRACEEQHRSGELSGIEPWRFHVLDAAACRRLHPQLPKENAGKIPAMLAAANALIMATWLPNAGVAATMDDEPGFAVTLTNVEHIAATAAAIQNLLLAATARGLANYWSSGGVLRSPSVFELLGIPSNQILLGAIFLFPQECTGAERATSKLRPHRTSPNKWSRWIS
jgi:nitroreductase